MNVFKVACNYVKKNPLQVASIGLGTLAAGSAFLNGILKEKQERTLMTTTINNNLERCCKDAMNEQLKDYEKTLTEQINNTVKESVDRSFHEELGNWLNNFMPD